MKAAQRTGFWQACRWGALVILAVGYSILAHRAAAAATPDFFGALVAVVPLLAIAIVMAWRSAHRPALLAVCVAAAVAMYAASDWLVSHYNWVFLLQHAGVHALLGIAFGRTLLPGRTPMVTVLARMVHGTLSPALIRYTRSVTWAWTLYFATTCVLSLLLFWLAPVAVWSAFANLLGPALLIAMFAVEYATRCLVLPAADRAGPLEAIRAYRRNAAGDTAHRS